MKATRITLLALIAAGALIVALLYFSPWAHADEPNVSDIVCRQLALGFTPEQVVKQLQGDPRYNAYSAVWDVIHSDQCCPVHWGCVLR